MYDFCAVMYFISRGIYGLQVKNNHKRKNTKNTLITFIAVTAGVATAGTDLTYWAENTGGDLLKIDTQYNSMPYLGNAAANGRVGPDVIDVLTSVGSKTYTLHLKIQQMQFILLLMTLCILIKYIAQGRLKNTLLTLVQKALLLQGLIIITGVVLFVLLKMHPLP